MTFSVMAFPRYLSFSRRMSSCLAFRTTLDHVSDSDNNKDDRDWQYVLHLAEDAARQAGGIMMQTTGRIAVSKQKANVRDIVTDADVACQQVIRQTIDAVFPNDVFLGEEDVGSGSQASTEALYEALMQSSGDEDASQQPLLWIVDPIDGTTNFQLGTIVPCVYPSLVSMNTVMHSS